MSEFYVFKKEIIKKGVTDKYLSVLSFKQEVNSFIRLPCGKFYTYTYISNSYSNFIKIFYNVNHL